MNNKVFFLLVGIAISFLSLQNAYAVTVYPGVNIANSHTNYTSDVSPNFNVTSMTINPVHIYLGNNYFDLNDTGVAPISANITSFYENDNATFTEYTTHAHTRLYVGPLPVQRVWLDDVLQPYGQNWFYSISSGGFSRVDLSTNAHNFHKVTVSFIPVNSTLAGGCSLVSAINGTVVSKVASISPTVSWFCNPPNLNVIATYLFQNGLLVQDNLTNTNVVNNFINHLANLKTAQTTAQAAYYVITYLNDTSGNTYAVKSNTIVLTSFDNLPQTFWELKYGATHTFNQSIADLHTFVHTTLSPLNYTVIVKNSTGFTFINQSYSTVNVLDQQQYNTSGSAYPDVLYIYAPVNSGQLIYSAYLGSPVSLSNVANFFHQYLSYKGFDLLNFLPIIFASMYTRNTVGVGVVMTTVLIATLNWLSVIVIPEAFIFVMIIIAILGLIGYRMSGYG